jgi:spore coat protein U-like protein
VNIGFLQFKETLVSKTAFSLTAALLLISASGFSVEVQAAGTSTQIPVTANVPQTCSVSTSNALAFGAYDAVATNRTAPLNASGTISVSCAKGATGLQIGMNNGAHNVDGQRQMVGAASAANLLSYNIFQPPSNTPGTACIFPGTKAWGAEGASTFVVGSPTSNAARNFNVCGTVPAAQDVSVDSYSDVLTAVINF